MKQNKKGFTLIEILVVVLIIGILAAIALPQYKMVVAKTKFGTLKTNAKVLADAAERYYLIHNTYPSNYDDLDVEIQGAQLTRSSVNDFDISLPDGSICSIWLLQRLLQVVEKKTYWGIQLYITNFLLKIIIRHIRHVWFFLEILRAWHIDYVNKNQGKPVTRPLVPVVNIVITIIEITPMFFSIGVKF